MRIRTQDAGTCPYLTNGKLYKVLRTIPGDFDSLFRIVDDQGDTIFVRGMHDAHTYGGTWEIVHQGEG